MILHVHLQTGRGSDLDYTLNTDRVTIIPDGNPAIVNITLHEDGIAREGEETLQLKLEPEPDAQFPSGEGAFCINILNLIIVDSDGK